MKKKESVFSVIPKALVFGLIIGIGFYFLFDKFGIKTYKAQSKILTTSNEKIKDDDKTAYTYAETVNSNAIKKRVIENLKLDMDPGELDKKIQIQAIANTHILNINVKDSIKLRAEDIADEYAEITVAVINQLYKADAVVIDKAYPNASLAKTSEKDSLKVGLAAFITYFIFGSLVVSIRNSKNNDEEEYVEEKEIRKVVFTKDDDKEEYDYENDYDNVKESYINEDGNLVQEYYDDEDNELSQDINSNEDLSAEEDEDFRLYQNKENNKDYTIIADMPKYDDGDLDV
ncbi:capsular biosynthesis protein [Anaerococcus obesiensis]|uniref:Capsular biosynthesis protein n=1 Tax=Anaerococcus obesiensis TaxID=1287640 RepID=A0A7T7ZVN2_9FIRM|nr:MULTISPECIES: capsular polysaccharide biosynthesis family protein YwqC [Anaerococcus]MDU5085685.1 capsular biosynthesis protein [Anaerococcus vaginalis]QQN56726.1 capsular biosynthesis protein [Anaerococcus obesiensis]